MPSPVLGDGNTEKKDTVPVSKVHSQETTPLLKTDLIHSLFPSLTHSFTEQIVGSAMFLGLCWALEGDVSLSKTVIMPRVSREEGVQPAEGEGGLSLDLALSKWPAEVEGGHSWWSQCELSEEVGWTDKS